MMWVVWKWRTQLTQMRGYHGSWDDYIRWTNHGIIVGHNKFSVHLSGSLITLKNQKPRYITTKPQKIDRNLPFGV
jgi:hypothetical protein